MTFSFARVLGTRGGRFLAGEGVLGAGGGTGDGVQGGFC